MTGFRCSSSSACASLPGPRYPQAVDVVPVAAGRRRESRPGRRALVVRSLVELTGPTAGVAELPHRMIWQEPRHRRFDLDDPYQLCRVYEIVLREAIRLDELRTWLDAVTLQRIWPDLYLPRGVRQVWEERYPELTRSGMAA
jgi:hypothetical protein